MAWQVVYDAQWGRAPVDATVDDWAQARQILSAELEESLRGEHCDECGRQVKTALRELGSLAEGSEFLSEVDGELYRIERIS